MKREIKFRGQLLHSREWVYGNLIIASNGQPYIIPFEHFEPDGHHLLITSDNPFWVDPATVGQYTGSKDGGEKDICEGDIIKDWRGIREVKFEIFDTEQGYDLELDDTDLQVIGSIYENPELLPA